MLPAICSLQSAIRNPRVWFLVAVLVAAAGPPGGAWAQVADERAGDFRVVVNERWDSALTYRGKNVVTREASGLAAKTNWATVFPSPAAQRKVALHDVPGGRQILLTAEEPGVGISRKVITVTPAWVDYHLEFEILPGREGAHQSQWFVVLDAVEGGAYSVQTVASKKDGTFHGMPGIPNLAQDPRFATVATAAGPMAFDFMDSDLGWYLDDYTDFWAKNFLFYNRKELAAKAGCRRRISFRVVPGAAGAPSPRFEPVPLDAACTTGFADEKAGDRLGGWIDDGPNDLRRIPTGVQTLRGIPFRIVDPARNAGKSCIVLRGAAWKGYVPRDYLPESATVAIGKRAVSLYFLHACAWPAPEGQTAARYQLAYEDGTTAELPLRSGYDLRDWYNIDEGDHSPIAWSGISGGGALHGVHLGWWRNPFPEKRIESLTFRSENTSAVPMLVAVTLSDAEPYVSGRPVDASLDATDTSGWFSFTFPWCDARRGTATDVGFLLDAPAGKHGFVTSRGGHLTFRNGRRARFWGVNLDRVPCFAHHRNAEQMAEHLAKYGVNLVRLHCLESFQPGGANVFDQKPGDSMHLSAENMDRLDYLLAQLKQRGIYVMIDLWGFRTFVPGDGVQDRDAWNASTLSVQGSVFFDARLQEIERDYARLLLTHVNPYTGLALKDDPMLALVQLFNEVTLFNWWSWGSMPPAYARQAQEQWNAWVGRRYPSREALAKAWTDAAGKCFLLPDEDPARGSVALAAKMHNLGTGKDGPETQYGDARLNDYVRFLHETEVRHARGMHAHLRGLGVQVPIGTSGDLGESATSAATAGVLDWVDQHTYWQHPSYPDGRIRLCRTPQVGSSPFAAPAGSPSTECPMNTVMRTAAVKSAGVPLLNCEWNVPWPNDHRMEGPLFLAAYACLQDWDGLLLYAWTPARGPGAAPEGERVEPAIGGFQSDTDPARAATWQAAAMLFLRGDLQPARKRVAVIHQPDDPFDALAGSAHSYRIPHGPRYAPWRFLPFISRVENCWEGRPPLEPADLEISPRLAAPAVDGRRSVELARGARRQSVVVPDDPNADREWLARAVREAGRAWGLWPQDPIGDGALNSDTGELSWNFAGGYFTADAPQSQVAVGRLGGRELRLSHLGVRAATEHCALVATSLDGKPLSRSGRILVCAGARARNTEQSMRRLGNWLTVLDAGRTPVLAEPVRADLSFRRDAKAPRLRAWSLDPAGARTQELPLQTTPQGVSLVLGTQAPSIYYELAAR